MCGSVIDRYALIRSSTGNIGWDVLKGVPGWIGVCAVKVAVVCVSSGGRSFNFETAVDIEVGSGSHGHETKSCEGGGCEMHVDGCARGSMKREKEMLCLNMMARGEVFLYLLLSERHSFLSGSTASYDRREDRGMTSFVIHCSHAITLRPIVKGVGTLVASLGI